jgi:hypothetical protein
MRKRRMIAAVLVLCAAAGWSQGVGLSYFFPFHGEGGLGLGIGAGLGLGRNVSIEGKVAYYQFDGLASTTDFAGSEGWFRTKTLLVDALLKVEAPVGIVTPYLLGGPAFIWNLEIVPYEGRIDRDYRRDLGVAVLNSNFDYDGTTGWGWSAGGGVKVRIKKITVDAGARYYRARIPLDIGGPYVTEGGPGVYAHDGSGLVMDGVLAVIGASFK